MRELREPITRKVFEGEACRVLVEVGKKGSVEAHIISLDRDVPLSVVEMTPEQFAALTRDLAAVNERVQEFARELVREPVGAGVRRGVLEGER